VTDNAAKILEEPRKTLRRRPWLAAVLSFFAPGVGQIYNSEGRRGTKLFLLYLTLSMVNWLVVPNLAQALVFLVSLLLIGSAIFCLQIVAAVDAFRWARRIGSVAPARYQRGWIYIVLILLVPVISDVGSQVRERLKSYSMSAGSMAPTIRKDDWVFSDQRYYRTHEPQRGDLAVFLLPTDKSTVYVKRIVGLPGDLIQMKKGVLYINDRPIARKRIGDYTSELAQYVETMPNGREYFIIKMGDNGPLDNTSIYQVPRAEYFVMGDNRDNSMDSRVTSAVGYIPAGYLVGRPFLVYWPPSRLGTKID
jgi:signal peptidase I